MSKIILPNTGVASMTRRSALGLLGGASVAALGGMSLIGSAPAFGSMTSTGRTYTPAVKGGKLTMAVSGGSTTDSLDPATYNEIYIGTVGHAVANNLVEIGPDRTPIPELATSWESSDGAKRWVFNIRQGVTFHNGKPLTPADVVYSLNRHLGESSTSIAKGVLAGVTSITAKDNSVIITHETGDADMPVILGDYHLQIVPEDFRDWGKMIGTGAYMVEEFEPGVRFRGRRNPNYWKADRGWVDEVEVLFLADAIARTNALISGEVMIIDRVDTKIVDRLKSISKFQLIEGQGGRYATSVMDVRTPTFADKNVRLAIKYGVDRQAIVDRVFQGYASLGNDHPIPSVDPFHHSELKQRTYDPDKARFHLKEAGLEKLDISLSTADAAYPGAVDTAVLMKEAGKAAGININVVREPNDGYWSNVWMKKPYCISNWTTRPTPGMMFQVAFACGTPWAEAFWCHEKFEQLMLAAKVETDFAKRKQMYWDMQEIVHMDGGNSIFAFATELDAYADNVQGPAADGADRMMGGRAIERVWLA
ncbi:ABC transporter substrate-binding protein [Pseudomonas benzenivorans]|uniref:ABC transporter substrate-binding protein n=1 Tax=Pseudomonas benzenivorans TaxID=556533 RepID=A0ABY5H7C3_9PSED|nr:ABC transporter substrate-binding protein [Pseudomonas benzenivorans]UTW08220.1 ABC transporter substrate-binding protein [Pseudomonas benzenivorans]